MEPVTSAPSVPLPLGSLVETCRTSDQLMEIFRTLESNRANDFYNEIGSRFELVNAVSRLVGANSLLKEQAEKIRSLCKTALTTAKTQNSQRHLNLILEQLEVVKYLPLTEDNLAEAFSIGLATKNDLLRDVCFDFIKKQTGVEFLWIGSGSWPAKSIVISDQFDIKKFQKLFPKIEHLFKSEWTISNPNFHLMNKPDLVIGFHQIFGKKLKAILIGSNWPIDQIIPLCPNAEKMQLRRVRLTPELDASLKQFPKPIEVFPLFEDSDEYDQSLIKIWKEGVEGKQIYVPLSGIPLSDLLRVSETDKTKRKQEVAKKLRHWAETLHRIHIGKQGGLGNLDSSSLSEADRKDYQIFWLDHLDETKLFKLADVYGSMFHDTKSEDIEREVVEPLKRTPLNDHNLLSILRKAIFLNATQPELSGICFAYIKDYYGIDLEEFKYLISLSKNWNAEKFEEIYSILSVLDPEIPLINAAFNLEDFQRFCKIIKDSRFSLKLCENSQLTPEDLHKAITTTPNLKKIIFHNYPKTLEFLTKYDVDTTKTKLVIFGGDIIEGEQLKKSILHNLIVKGDGFKCGAPLKADDFQLLDQSIIDQFPFRCLDLFLLKCPNEKIPDNLFTRRNVFALTSDFFKSKNTKLLSAWPQISKVLTEKYASLSPEVNGEALHLLKAIHDYLRTPDYYERASPEQKQFLKELFLILPAEIIKNDARTLDCIQKMQILPRGLGVYYLPRTLTDSSHSIDRDTMRSLCFEDIRQTHDLDLGYFEQSDEFLIHSFNPAKIKDTLPVLLLPLFNRVKVNHMGGFEASLELYKSLGPKITSISLYDNGSLTDDQLNQIFSYCPAVKELHLNRLPEITGASLALFKSLKTLRIVACPKLTILPTFLDESIESLYVSDSSIPLSKENLHGFKNIYLTVVSITDVSLFENLRDSQSLVVLADAISESLQRQFLTLMLQKKGVTVSGIQFKEEIVLHVLEDLKKKPLSAPGIKNLYEMVSKNDKLLKLYIPLLAKLDPVFYKNTLSRQHFKEAVQRLFPSDRRENIFLYPVSSSQSWGAIRLSLLTMKPLYDPHAVLEELCSYESIPEIRIEYEDSSGIDASGLSRQFISQEFQGLCECPGEYFYLEMQDDGRYLPVLKGELDEKPFAFLTTIGKLLALATLASGAYPIGEVLPLRFFAAMTKLNEQELNSELSADRAEALYQELLDEPSKKLMQKYSSLIALDPNKSFTDEQKAFLDGLLIEHKGAQTEPIRKELMSIVRELRNAKLIPLQVIAQGFASALPIDLERRAILNWEMLQGIPAARLEKLIQGKISKEAFLEKVVISIAPIHGVVPTSEELAIQAERIADIKSWIEEWVRTHSIDEIKKVVIAITGASSISLPMKFKVCMADGMMAHTCFNLVDVPTEFTKARFMEQMNEWGAGRGITAFNRA